MIGAALVIIGAIIFVAVMTAYRWDFSKLGSAKYETNTYEITEDFSSICVNTETADILFVASEDGTCRVVCYESEKTRHSVEVRDGTLTVAMVDERAWVDHIGFSFKTPKITVYLPASEYASVCIKESTGDVEIPKNFSFESMDISISTGDVKNYASASGMVKIKASTGDILVEGVSAGAMDISVTTGKVTASDVNCQGDVTINVSTGKAEVTNLRCVNLTSDGSTGNIKLNNVIADELLSVERSTGDVRLDGCDAGELYLKTTTGSITGTLLTEKVFQAKSTTGRVDVPNTITGGRCAASTTTGNIEISITN
jgi:DUF4097 and DUF4098 domain-containing protein YvlB